MMDQELLNRQQQFSIAVLTLLDVQRKTVDAAIQDDSQTAREAVETLVTLIGPSYALGRGPLVELRARHGTIVDIQELDLSMNAHDAVWKAVAVFLAAVWDAVHGATHEGPLDLMELQIDPRRIEPQWATVRKAILWFPRLEERLDWAVRLELRRIREELCALRSGPTPTPSDNSRHRNFRASEPGTT